MPLFQLILVLSFLIVLVVVNRLYHALRILNSRVEILSSLIKTMRAEMKSDEEDDTIQEYLSRETLLQAEMGSSFNYSKKGFQQFSGKSLLRSNIYPAAETSSDMPRQTTQDFGASPREEVSLKEDLSYLHTNDKPVSIEKFPNTLPPQDQPLGHTTTESNSKS